MKILVKRRFWIGLLLAAVLILVIPVPTGQAAATERTIRIEASRFEYSPSTLYINPGDQVTIELVSKDIVHGLSIDGYGVEMTADPGQTMRATFVANKTGVFRFRCTVTCGNMHPFMIGKLQIGADTLFWRITALGLLAMAAGAWKLRA